MNRNELTLRMRSIAICLVTVFFVLNGVVVMSSGSMAANEAEVKIGGSGEGFGIVGLNGHESGSNSVWVWLSGNIRIARSDTANDLDLSGVGIFDASLSPSDLALAQSVHRKLCEAVTSGPKNEMPPIEPPTIYIVECLQNGKLVRSQGRTFELGRSLNDELVAFFLRTRNSYPQQGRSTVDLNVEVANVERVTDGFLVAIRFVNRGHYSIQIETPDRWSRDLGYLLGFGGANESDNSGWGGGNLAGLPLVNKSEFSGDIAVIPAQSGVIFKFLTKPQTRFTAGTYKFNASVNAFASVQGIAPNLGRVVFHSDYAKPTRIKFDQDYVPFAER